MQNRSLALLAVLSLALLFVGCERPTTPAEEPSDEASSASHEVARETLGAEDAVAVINGRSISRETYDDAVRDLIASYEEACAQMGQNIHEFLAGAEGRLHELRLQAGALETLLIGELFEEEAERRGADEGIWRNTRGHLAEGCASNLFVVRRRALYTPGEGEGILPGVVRDLVLAAAREAGLLVHEGRVRVVRLERADEAFLSSSLRAVRPLVRFEGRPVGNGAPGPISELLADAVQRSRRRTFRDDA